MNSELLLIIDELSKVEDNWAGFGTYAPTKNIINRAKELVSYLEIPETHQVEIGPLMHGTIEIEITQGAWKMAAEIGETSANYYTIDANMNTSTYSNDVNTNSLDEMANHMNKNM